MRGGGQRVAALYGVAAKQLNQQVKRNSARFPTDFVFRLRDDELGNLRSQIVTSSERHGGRRFASYAFTEHGAIMAAMVLNSPRAVEMSVFVVRAFVQLRETLNSSKEFAMRVDDLERRILGKLETHDQAITGILKALRELMNPPEPQRRPIGFIELQEKK